MANYGSAVYGSNVYGGDTTPPTVPSSVVATAISINRIDVSWSASTDPDSAVTGYTVYRGGSSIGTTAGLSYSDTTVLASTTYSYTIDAFDAAGNHSAQSSSASATTPAPPPPPPSPPAPSLSGALARIGPVTSTLGTVYSAGQIMAMLFAPSLNPSWYFDLLGPDFSYKADLSAVVDFSRPPIIDYDSTRAVKRTLRGLTLRAQGGVDQQRDLIRVRFRIPAPDGGILEWVIGTFMMQTPKRVISEGITWWTLDAPDLSQKLARASFGGVGLIQSTMVGAGLAGLAQAGAGYPATISALVQSYGGATPLSTDVPEPANKIPADLVFDVGSSYLKAINDLLSAIAYTSVYARAEVMTSRPLANYAYTQPLMTLDTLAGGAQIFGPFSEAVDPSAAFNKALVLSEDPRRATIKGYYENDSPDSAVSLANSDPFLTVIRDSKIASELAAYYRARAVVQEAARVYAVLSIGMVPFPFFEDLDMIQLVWSSVDEGIVNQPYLVIRYQHTCGLAATTLDLQRVVPV